MGPRRVKTTIFESGREFVSETQERIADKPTRSVHRLHAMHAFLRSDERFVGFALCKPQRSERRKNPGTVHRRAHRQCGTDFLIGAVELPCAAKNFAHRPMRASLSRRNSTSPRDELFGRGACLVVLASDAQGIADLVGGFFVTVQVEACGGQFDLRLFNGLGQVIEASHDVGVGLDQLRLHWCSFPRAGCAAP